MTEERAEQMKAETMSWDEHLRAGVRGLKAEVRDEMNARRSEALREARRHGRNAMKEMLLAWRSVLDGAINRIDDVDDKSKQRVTKIKIE